MLHNLVNLIRPRPTFRDLSDRWLADKEHELRPQWFLQARRILRSDIIPWIGERPAHRLQRREIAQIAERIEGRGSPRVAGMALVITRSIVRHGIGKGLIDVDPTIGLKAAQVRQRDRVLTHNEIRAIWRAAGDDDHGRIIKLLLASGQRRGEIGGLRWTEIDLLERRIELPGNRTKNHRPHTVPMTPLMMDLLPAPRSTHPHVFGKLEARGFSGWSKGKRQLDRACGIEGWQVHDLRRTCASELARLGVQLSVIEKLLNHVSGSFRGVAGIYVRHQFENEKREALLAWNAELERIVNHG